MPSFRHTGRQFGRAPRSLRHWGMGNAPAVIGSLLLACLAAPTPLRAQDFDQTQLARADSARAALVRPPAKPPADFTSVLEVPFKIIGFPFLVLTEGIGFIVGQVTLPKPPSFLIATLRDLDEQGLTIGAATSIGPRSGFSATANLSRFHPFYATSGISVRGSRAHSAGFRLGRVPGGNYLDIGWAYQRDASRRFWGIGSSTTPDLLSQYELQAQVAGATGRYWVHPTVGVEARFHYASYEAADRFSDDDPSVGQTFGPIFGLNDRP